MAYIGNNPDAIQNSIEITRFNGDAACTQFQIPQDVDDAKAIEVLVNSVQQDPDNSYTVTNGLITFSEAPSVGTNNVTVLRRTGLTFTRTQIDVGDILPNAVTTIAIADGSITAAKIANGTIVTAEIADGAVTGPKLGLTAINANNIVDATITGPKLGQNAINANNIVDGAITGPKLGQNAINANNVVSGIFAAIDTAQTFTKGQRGEITALSDGASITPDFADSNNFSITLGGNRTLANATNVVAGQSGSIFVTQDGTGSRTLAYGSIYDFAGGTAPTLSTAAAAVDRIDYVVRTTGSIHCVFTANYS